MNNNFSLPTPQEVDYYQNELIDNALEKIKLCINERVFSFKPEPRWNFRQMGSKLNAAITPFGWRVETSWVGSKDDGYDTWIIKPL